MKKVSYYEDWEITNPNEFDYLRIDEDLGAADSIHSGTSYNLPDNFDVDLFNDKQIDYLVDYLRYYRKDNIKHLLSFLISPVKDLRINSERSRKAIQMRMLCRLVLLHRNGAKLLRAFSQIVEGNEKGNRKRAAFWGCPFFIGQLLKAADCFLLQGGFVRA